MYVDTSTITRNGKRYTRYLLRESYREQGQVKHRTLANLSTCALEEIEAIRWALRHKHDLLPLDAAHDHLVLRQGLSVGALWLVYAVAQQVGIVRALGTTRAGQLALWQVLARVIDQGSRLSAVRLAGMHAVCDVLGLEKFNEEDLYENLDWLCAQQTKIEDRLAKQRLQGRSPGLFLYDVTSSYFEGEQNALAAFGYNRDGKKGKRQIVLGLLCDEEGKPLSIEVFPGNTQDPQTVAAHIRKVTERFGGGKVVFVGDRGMLKRPQIEALVKQGLHYITAITKPQIVSLLKSDVLHIGLFEDAVTEVTTSEGRRYILRRNPIRAQEMQKAREEKYQTLQKAVEKQNRYLTEHPRAKVDVALRHLNTQCTKLVTVHVVKRYLPGCPSFAYDDFMDTPPLLPPEIWDRTPPEAQALLVSLATRVATLEATVQALTEQLRQDSRTSSRPPSSDAPARQRPRRRRQPSGRRPGGQPGHHGQTRELLPVEEVDEVIALHPTHCAQCQQPLDGDDPQPQRHQVYEIPPMQPVVTEYHVHRLTCPGCGETTHAAWPAGVPTGRVGPRAQAVAALCTGAYRLSKRTTQRVLDDLFGLPVSLGSLSTLEAATTTAVAAPVAEARGYVQEQASVHLDETGWRQGGTRAWLWVATTTWVTVFVVRLSRGGDVARELLGEMFAGILVTDRWSAYNWYPVRWRQLCWAHLLRDIEAMSERGGRSREIGEALKRQAQQMFHWWHRVRDGTLSRSSFRSYMSPVRREVERLLKAGSTCGVAKTEGVCRALLKRRQALWTFVHLEGVEPTNNAAERAIRPGVLWRKGSFGTQSDQGSRFVESMMTVVTTLKQQQHNVLDYLTAACEAALRHTPAPSLLPESHVTPSDQIAA